MMMAPYSTRLGMFIFATISVTMFFGNTATVVIKYISGSTPTDSFGEMINAFLLVLQFAAFVPSVFIFVFDGLAFSPYSIFNEKYGKWDDIKIPGQQTRNNRLL